MPPDLDDDPEMNIIDSDEEDQAKNEDKSSQDDD